MAGRKEVIGRPILYKTSRAFLIYFGLNSLDELPSVEEFEELIKTEQSAQAVLPLEAPIEEDDEVGEEDEEVESAEQDGKEDDEEAIGD